jgi:uncharacterized protein
LILLDASGLLAAVDPKQNRHEEAARALTSARPPYLLSPFVLAELDYLFGQRLGKQAQLLLLEEVVRGAYRLADFSRDDVETARGVVAQYADLDVGLADASIVVLARRHLCNDVLTLDERHFRILQGPAGPFRLLPADA